MAYDVIYNYPEYLRDFDVVKALAKWQSSTMNSLESAERRMLIDLHPTYFAGDIWKELYDMWDSSYAYRTMVTFLKRREGLDLATLKDFAECWITTSDCEMEYDNDTMTLTLKTKKSGYHTGDYKKIRKIIPCNMELVIELTE